MPRGVHSETVSLFREAAIHVDDVSLQDSEKPRLCRRASFSERLTYAKTSQPLRERADNLWFMVTS